MNLEKEIKTRITQKTHADLKAAAKKMGAHYNVSDVIRDAIDQYFRVEEASGKAQSPQSTAAPTARTSERYSAPKKPSRIS